MNVGDNVKFVKDVITSDTVKTEVDPKLGDVGVITSISEVSRMVFVKFPCSDWSIPYYEDELEILD